MPYVLHAPALPTVKPGCKWRFRSGLFILMFLFMCLKSNCAQISLGSSLHEQRFNRVSRTGRSQQIFGNSRLPRDDFSTLRKVSTVPRHISSVNHPALIQPMRQSDENNETTTNSTESETDASNNGTDADASMTFAFQNFKLFYVEENFDDDNEPFKSILVFDNGSLVGPFENNPFNLSAMESQTTNKSNWFTHNTVTDRMAFRFEYDPDLSYVLREPDLKTTEESTVQPLVTDFQVNKETGTGSFTVLYRCIAGKPGQGTIALHMLITEGHSIQTVWVKDCGQGRFQHLSFGFLDHEGRAIEFNADGTYGNEEHKTLDVGPMDSLIDLVAILTSPAKNLNFLTPYVTSDNEDVYVMLRSTVQAGRLSADEETQFTILHECDRKSVANIKFTAAITPWDNITATWRKDCGGSVSQSLLVGTEGENSFDVIQEGTLLPEFKVTELTTVDNVDSRVTVVSADQHALKFYLTNADDTSDIHFQTITTTLSNPDVLRAFIGSDGQSSLSSDGGILERNQVRTLLISLVCKQAGKSVVLVTLPTMRYATAEFGFVKECDGAPMTYTHSGFLNTAESLMGLIMFLLIIAGIGGCLYAIRKRSKQRYEPVSSIESAM